MRFNNGLERKRFENNWEKLRIEYRQAGMDEEAIEAMYEFDLEQYKEQRSFCRYNQFVEVNDDPGETPEDDGMLLMMKRFASKMSTADGELDKYGKYSWIELIKDIELHDMIADFEPKDIEILTLKAFWGYSQTEIALKIGINQQAVSKRMCGMKEKLKKFC
jgi:DNA-directed RNA polymerase specialized sigma subunit